MPKKVVEEANDDCRCCCSKGGRMRCGFFLVLLGVLLLLGNYGFLDSSVIKLWPLLLVAAGAWMAYRETSR